MLNLLLKMSRGIALLLLVIFVLSIAPCLSESRADDWKKVTIVYSGDINGKIEPCG